MKLLTNQIRKERSFIDQVTTFVTQKIQSAKFNKVSKVRNILFYSASAFSRSNSVILFSQSISRRCSLPVSLA